MLLKDGSYKGKITAVERKTYEKKDKESDKKVKFDMIIITVKIIGDIVKTLKKSMSVDFAVKYFKEFCQTPSNELVGKDCQISVYQKAFDGKDGQAFCNEIRFLNLLDDETGEPIIMAKDKDTEDLF